MLNLKIPEDLQALYRSGEILAGMGYNSGGYMCRLIEHIATLTQQLAEAEAKVESLNKMRTHCENCGGDYLATGLELGCPCLLEARLKVLDNTLDVERDAFRNMQMQKEALEARVKELEEHSAVCEKHPLYQCALVTEEGVDWVLEFDDSGTGPETILEDARAALADERKEAPHGD